MSAALPVLIVVDVQHGFLNEHTAGVPERIDAHLRAHRDRYSAIIATVFVNEHGSMFERRMRWTQMLEHPDTALDSRIADHQPVIVRKPGYGCAPELLAVMDFHRTREAHLCGIDTEVCVLQNAGALFDAGRDITVLSDLCGSTAGELAHRGGIAALGRTVGREHVMDVADVGWNPDAR